MIKVPVIDHHIDPLHPFHPSFIGPIRESVWVNGRIRHYIVYVPSEVRSSTAGLFVFPDNGVSAEALYEKSNWAELAETDEWKEKFIVFFLEPENGIWRLETPEEDLQYMQAVFQKSRERDKFCVHEAKNYLIGYGTGGTMAQMAAMDNPSVYAGIATVDAPEMTEDYIHGAVEAPCTSLFLYEDTDYQYGYRKKDFTVPAWIISSHSVRETADGPTARHWRTAAKTDAVPRQLRPDVWEYYRTEPAPWTVNQEKEAFRVWISQMRNASADYGRAINRRIWSEFLRGVRRWGAEPGGDLRVTKDPVANLGMEYHYEKIDGWMREYYVYVPTSLRGGFNEPVPLVFACHGYSCSGEIYVGNSEWHKVAEDNGFIVAFPSAVHGYLRAKQPNEAVGDHDTELPAWNLFEFCEVAPDELAFFDAMLERICSAYPIDRGRIFVTGHSLGSLMTQYLGMARPDRFAGIAPCSGVLLLDSDKLFPAREAVRQRVDWQMPVWMFGGEKEEWLLEAVPSSENTTGKSIYAWWELNHMTSKAPNNFDEVPTVQNGRWHDYIFSEGGIPMIRYTWVEEMPHATMTEMSYRIWEEFFSRIRRREDGTIEYRKQR